MCGFAGCLTDRSLTEKATYDQTVHTMTKMLYIVDRMTVVIFQMITLPWAFVA